MNLATIRERAARDGLALTGWLRPGSGDGAPAGTRALLLLGHGGPEMWACFRAAPEAGDGNPHPLDRWSRRVIGALAAEIGATALFPFGGPPYQPFIRWTYAGEPIHQSKLGMAVHEERGLWSGWRGALALFEEIDLPPVIRGAHPCEGCAAPCRAACPVSAFTDAGYDVARCRAHLDSAAGAPCRARGCLARRACPVGARFAQSDEQGAFHLEAFRVA
ncbi:ferredoxin [Pikeienuella piscinae]|uniref:Ferredoxin n=1 Tax=Pikeienuella piscinae TaxID=2748098 RepID=A0A7L5BU17_9RHOB|nr:ferredoxin [Pikeienuella piscinae]QIE54671.1 ferredoxin [Pikeienuella piscinae]